MSFEALNWALKLQTGGPGSKALLLALANYADEAHSCYPSQAALAEITCQGVRTVQRQLVQLETLGLIQVQARGRSGGGRISNRYVLRVGTKPANLADNPSAPPASGVSKPAICDNQTRHLRQPNPPPVAEEPSLNHHQEPPEKNAEHSSAGVQGEPALFEPPAVPAKAKREPDPVNVNAKALADQWHTLTNGMANFHAVRAVMVKALRAGHAYARVEAAMRALHERRIPLTAGALDIELRGGIGTGAKPVAVYRDSDEWATRPRPKQEDPVTPEQLAEIEEKLRATRKSFSMTPGRGGNGVR